MKKIFFVSALFYLSACGASSDANQTEEITEQQESEIVDAITTDLTEAQEELKKETEESLTEIDSLLENF